MKTVNIYFQSVTKTQVGNIKVEDDINMEDLIQQWITAGVVKCHYIDNASFIYIPWNSVIYIQHKD